MKKADKIILVTTLFILISILCYVLTKSIVESFIISFLLTVTIVICSIHIAKRYNLLKKIPVSKIEDGLAFMGIHAQTKLLFDSISDFLSPKEHDFYFTLQLNCQQIAVFPNYKFASCSKDDISKFFRICVQNDIKECYVLSRQNSRDIIIFAKSLPLDFHFIKTKEVRNYLSRHNIISSVLIPKKQILSKQKKSPKEIFRDIFENFVTKERAKYFLITGLSLAFLCVFTPYKIYYAVFSAISLVLAIVCIIKNAV